MTLSTTIFSASGVSSAIGVASSPIRKMTTM